MNSQINSGQAESAEGATTEKSLTLHAANDNAGGATETIIALSALVSVMAKAYVAKSRQEEERHGRTS